MREKNAFVRKAASAVTLIYAASVAFVVSAAAAEAPAASAPAQAAPPAATPPAAPQTIEIDAYDVDGNTLLPQMDVESAIYPFLGPGKTREDIEGARKALESAYQQRGYQTVVVELPPQRVTAGIVKLHVIEAPIGKLRVTGANYTAPTVIKDQIPSLEEGKVPDFSKVQKEIADANRLPDRRVTPALKPGRVPGTVDVELKVNDSLPLHASLELNNDHGPSTKSLRALATVRYDNLWQLGHSLSGTALIAPERTKDAKVFAGSYLAPIWGSPWSVLLYGYSSNSDVTTLGSLDVLGKGYAIGLRGILQMSPWGDFSQSLNFGVDFKHFLEGLSLSSSSVSANIEYWPLSATYSLQNSTGESVTNINLAATLGLRGLGSGVAAFQNKRASASPSFLHLNLDADYTQTLFADIALNLRLSGQLADGPLVSTEQFAAGGFTSVRGYLQSEGIGDDGVFGSVELRSPSVAPYLWDFVKEWRAYLFYDAAQVWLLKPQAGQQSSFTLMAAGAGTRIELFDHLFADTLLGIPLLSEGTTKARHPYVEFKVKTEF